MSKTQERRQRFISCYLETLNATEAARRAGYKNPNVMGPRLRADPKIKPILDEQLRAAADARLAKAKEVMERLTSIMRGEPQTRRDKNGKEFLEYPSHRDSLRAAEGLMKRYGLFLSDIEIEEKRARIKQLEREADGEDEGRAEPIIITEFDGTRMAIWPDGHTTRHEMPEHIKAHYDEELEKKKAAIRADHEAHRKEWEARQRESET